MRFSGCVPYRLQLGCCESCLDITLFQGTTSTEQVDDDVSQDDIKTAYRQAAKFCHPDVNDAGHELCILLNEVCHINSQCR